MVLVNPTVEGELSGEGVSRGEAFKNVIFFKLMFQCGGICEVILRDIPTHYKDEYI